MRKKVEEKNQVPSVQDIDKVLALRTEADNLLRQASNYKRKADNRTGWAIFFGIVSFLLVVGLTLVAMPVLSSEPIVELNSMILAIAYGVAALFMFLTWVLVACAKAKYYKCLRLLVRRGDIPNSPLYIKMV